MPAGVFAHRSFALFAPARLLAELASQMQSVAIGWQVYALTGRPIDLAWVGLAQFVPVAALSLWAGQVADRVERRRILLVCDLISALLSLALCWLARSSAPHPLVAIYASLVGVGVARAFAGPAGQAIVPSLVPAEDFAHAVAWSSSFWQAAVIVGPMVGGVVYAATGRASPVYALAAGCSVAAALLLAAMRRIAVSASPDSDRSLWAGVRYVWRNSVILGATSLDLFAVLLGGATALLPIFARDILHLGPWALGTLRSAPAVGAATMALVLARFPIARAAGKKMFLCVALFGVATLLFGLSRWFWLSLLALVVAGAADMVSVVVRASLVQLATPEAMRGRVSAVSAVFIGASSELGELESGLTAQWLGPVTSVVVGGVGTLVVVALWMWRFPRLRDVDALVSASERADHQGHPAQDLE